MEIPSTMPIKVHNEEIFVGKTVNEIEKETGIRILAVVRDGQIIKDSNERIIPGDTIIFWGDVANFKTLLEQLK